MFNIEQTTKQQQLVSTGFSINQVNYINLNSSTDKQILVYVTISFDDGSTKDDTIKFSGADYNDANTAFVTWRGIISFVEDKLGLKLSIPENVEEVFQNASLPIEEKVENVNEKIEQNTDVTPADIEPISLAPESTDEPLE